MIASQIVAQLYTVRDYIQNPADIAKSLKKVRDIGYRAVQVSGMGPIPEAELKAILDGEGLVCCATHEGAERILNEPQAIVDRLNALDCQHTAYPHPANVDLSNLAGVDALAARLNTAGKLLHSRGLTLSYHNHHIEFRKVGGQTILSRLMQMTDPHYLQLELDTYWAQYGGGDPVEWCIQSKGRLPLLHLKDYEIGEDNQPHFASIGRGNLDWQRIILAAEASGCQWFIVEQDTCPGDPFDSLQQSYEYLVNTFCMKEVEM